MALVSPNSTVRSAAHISAAWVFLAPEAASLLASSVLTVRAGPIGLLLLSCRVMLLVCPVLHWGCCFEPARLRLRLRCSGKCSADAAMTKDNQSMIRAQGEDEGKEWAAKCGLAAQASERTIELAQCALSGMRRGSMSGA